MNIEKKIVVDVLEPIRGVVWCSMRDHVELQVEYNVRSFVFHSSRDGVNDSIWSSVRNTIRNKLCEYEY